MKKIDTLYNEWKSLQALKPEDKKRLDDKFNLEFNFNYSVITTELNRFDYKIHCANCDRFGSNDFLSLEKRYDESISEQEVKRVINAIGENLTEFYQTNV